MYSILLVEDELVELDTLRNYVDWEGCGIEKVYTARGARGAMGIVAEHEPDIVITDIQMPKVSGIELARMINEEGYHCKIVFLTGYDKFEYARQAVQLHAEDFLLKPFQVDEVEALVTKIIEKIKKERQNTERGQMASGKIVEQMCLGFVEDMNAVCEMYFQQSPQNLRFQMLGINRIGHQFQAEIEKIPGVIHCFRIDKMTIILLHASASTIHVFDSLKNIFSEYRICGITAPANVSANELPVTCRNVSLCQDDLFFASPGELLQLRDHKEYQSYSNRIEKSEQTNMLLDAINRTNVTLAIHLLVDIFHILEGLKRSAYCQNLFSLYLFLKEKTETDHLIEIADKEILEAESASILKNRMIEYVQKLVEEYKSKETNHISNFVKHYIELHYMEDCTVEEMAEAVKLSPNYLRKKFKDEVGITILECLTEYRLKEAERLLKYTGNRVKAIGGMVGYENISYFTRLFSKKYGMTPNEYRKKYR